MNWQLLQSLIEDSRRLSAAISGLAQAPEELKEACELLVRVTEQDITEGANGRIEIKQGVAKDRIISVNDPEMRHGHKTSSYLTDGDKGNIMVGGSKGPINLEEMSVRCPASQETRTRMHYHEGLLQQAKKHQKTDEFKKKYSRRSAVERTIAYVTRHGARYARYLGRAKTEFQIQMAAALHNIKAHFTALMEEAKPVLV